MELREHEMTVSHYFTDYTQREILTEKPHKRFRSQQSDVSRNTVSQYCNNTVQMQQNFNGIQSHNILTNPHQLYNQFETINSEPIVEDLAQTQNHRQLIKYQQMPHQPLVEEMVEKENRGHRPRSLKKMRLWNLLNIGELSKSLRWGKAQILYYKIHTWQVHYTAKRIKLTFGLPGSTWLMTCLWPLIVELPWSNSWIWNLSMVDSSRGSLCLITTSIRQCDLIRPSLSITWYFLGAVHKTETWVKIGR